MEILEGLESLKHLPPGAVLSVGNFDGVHRGHQRILEIARSLRAANPGAKLVAVTFEPHPLTVLRPEHAPPRLTPPALKQELLSRQGVDTLVTIAPTRDVLDLTAEQFWAILRDDVRPRHMVEGRDFNFGKGRGGNIDRLREWSAASEIQLHVADAVKVALLNLQVVPVSSSLIRWLLAHGRVRDAAICLGRPYALEGTVIEGHKRGRTIGVPTANLCCTDQLIPADGVYTGRAEVDGRTYAAAVSIGRLPTFGDDQPRQVEAHLIGFSGDLYRRTLRVELLGWTREQVRFGGVEELKRQLARDIEQTTELSRIDAARPLATVT